MIDRIDSILLLSRMNSSSSFLMSSTLCKCPVRHLTIEKGQRSSTFYLFFLSSSTHVPVFLAWCRSFFLRPNKISRKAPPSRVNKRSEYLHCFSQSMPFAQASNFYHDELEPALSMSVSLRMKRLHNLYALILSICLFLQNTSKWIFISPLPFLAFLLANSTSVVTHERDKFQVLGLLPAPRRVGRDWRTKNLREKREIFNFVKSSELLQKKARQNFNIKWT